LKPLKNVWQGLIADLDMKKTDFIRKITHNGYNFDIIDINILEKKGIAKVKDLPFSIKILVENLLRKLDGNKVTETDVLNIANLGKKNTDSVEIPYHPARVLMQDFTGVPAVVDLASMRNTVKRLGADPARINPIVPVELIIDHSVYLDYAGTKDSLNKNVKKEYKRNDERYKLLKWAQKSFDNFKVIPPNSGICHQVNLEYLSKVIMTEKNGKNNFLYPDTVVGTDSHTTMINGLGIMGWGVGGIEAEAVMLGQPYYMPIPEVVGVKLIGSIKKDVCATDIAIYITQLLRELNVVEKFVEYFGPSIKDLPVTDRATIANMAPEYGATMGFFPIDEKSIEYLEITGRKKLAKLVEKYEKEAGFFYSNGKDVENLQYTKVIEVNLAEIEPCVTGPAKPKDRIVLKDLKQTFDSILDRDFKQEQDKKIYEKRMYEVNLDGNINKIGDGSIVIAAITSCTNTSNPYVLIGAGLLAKKAVEKGIKVPGHVKTSFTPGSKVVKRYLNDSGLMPYLEALGFHIAGFGCTTCIGNSGNLHPKIEKITSEKNLYTVCVLSGNRNFEARIHQNIKGNFLTSPILVVAFAIAGRIDIDLAKEPIAFDPNQQPVFLSDIIPSSTEINRLIAKYNKANLFEEEYKKIFEGDKLWQNLSADKSTTYKWEPKSTYIKEPPYFKDFDINFKKPEDITNAKPLLLLGDSITTDHISPAGAIPENYPAGLYLKNKGVAAKSFNSYGSRRGNHEVMVRGTFGNIKLTNMLATPKQGSYTTIFPNKNNVFTYDAAIKYKENKTPLIVLGGKEYGTGSSRDWAAKGTKLLGIKAVIASSFERIHRSNLVGMGVLPLMFKDNESWETLGIDGSETFTISGIKNIKPKKELNIKATKEDGNELIFKVIARLDTNLEVAYFEKGGILQYVLNKMLK